MASLAIAAAGAAAGAWAAPVGWSMFGMSGASLGWSLGSVAGERLFAPTAAPNTSQDGPQIGDLNSTITVAIP